LEKFHNDFLAVAPLVTQWARGVNAVVKSTKFIKASANMNMNRAFDCNSNKSNVLIIFANSFTNDFHLQMGRIGT
jgi:hypothetical protein